MHSIYSMRRVFLALILLDNSTLFAQTPEASKVKPASETTQSVSDVARDKLTGITMSEALDKVERFSPMIIGADSFLASVEGRKISASAFPNPELSIEMEKFAGTGSSKGYDRAEVRTSISQMIELGGKRGKRMALADAEFDASKLSSTLVRIEVKNNVQLLFNEILRLQQLGTIHASRRAASEDFLEAASRRFNAGIGSPVEKAKAQVSYESAKLDFDRSQVELLNAKTKLSVMWGEKEPSFSKVIGDLNKLPIMPEKEKLIENIKDNSQVAFRQKEIEVRRVSLEVQRANSIPDLTLSGGVIVAREDNSKGALVGLSMPIPIFQSNRGGVLETSKLLEQAQAIAIGETQLTVSQITAAYQTYNLRRTEALYLESTVLKSADQAMDFAMRAFRLGRLNYLEVIEAQRTLFEAKLQYLEATSSAHVALIELEKLTKLEFHIN